MDVIIFGGQNNMQGQSDTLTSAEVVADCYEYKFLANEMVPLKNPVGEDITFDRMQSYRYEQGTNLIDWLNAHITVQKGLKN